MNPNKGIPRENDDGATDYNSDDLEWGCQFPDTCVMPGRHMLIECHTAEMIIAQEEAMNLDQIKRKTRLGASEPACIDDLLWADVDWLIAEVERLNGADKALENSAAYAERLRKEKTDLEQLREAMLKQNAQQEQEIEELENRLCAMRGVLMEVAEDDDPRDGCAHADRAKQALASAPECGHKEHDEAYKKVVKAFESGADGILTLVNEIIEQRGLKQQLATLQVALNEAREQLAVGEAGGRLLKAIQEKTEAEVVALQADAIVIRFDGPPGLKGGRFVEVETLDGKSIKAGEWKPDGQYWLLVIPGLNRVATLQAALDEANGRVMEWEFRAAHSQCQHQSHSDIWFCKDSTEADRHSWSRERWTEEAKAMREKG